MERTVVQQPLFADPAVRAAALLLDLCLLGLLTWLVFLFPGSSSPIRPRFVPPPSAMLSMTKTYLVAGHVETGITGSWHAGSCQRSAGALAFACKLRRISTARRAGKDRALL